MITDVLIQIDCEETRVALLSKECLEEIHIEQNTSSLRVGNIYKGRITRLVPGMQAAFVNIGLLKSGFLHLFDTLEFIRKKNQTTETVSQDIRDYFYVGQNILVQIYKDTLGTKAIKLTTQLSFLSRQLVFIPGKSFIQVSQKITDTHQRTRLLEILKSNDEGGYVIRTAAEKSSAEIILKDQERLTATWQTVLNKMRESAAGDLIYEELSLPLRTVRDQIVDPSVKILVDDNPTVKEMRTYAAIIFPEIEKQIDFYDNKIPLLDLHTVNDQIEKMLENKVLLKSGGYLIINPTEAMITIDVNTGSFLGTSQVRETAFLTNLEAVETIAREVRLRNLGGIIIIDFIDMPSFTQREQVLDALRHATSDDSAKVEVSELSSLGLVQMTRKRVRNSIEHILCDPCPTCQKRGLVKSIQTIAYEIVREIKRLEANKDWPGYCIKAADEVVQYLLINKPNRFEALKQQLQGKRIEFQRQISYGREQYSVLPLI